MYNIEHGTVSTELTLFPELPPNAAALAGGGFAFSAASVDQDDVVLHRPAHAHVRLQDVKVHF